MLKNYLVIAIRNILNQKFFSILNILGLAVGIATFLFIYVYVKSEEFYDKDWENSSSIYRISQHVDFGKGTDYFALSASPLASELKQNFPEIKHTVRLTQYFRRPVKIDTTFHEIERIVFAGEDFFKVFNFELIQGVVSQALVQENSVVISKELADDFFPNSQALGQTISFSGKNYQVKGVFKLSKTKSHLRPQIIASLSTVFNEEEEEETDKQWMRLWAYTYMELKSPDLYESFMVDFDNWQDTTMYAWQKKTELNYNISFHPQPIREIHFDHLHTYSLSESADPYYFRILTLVAFLVLLIASVNFVNLGTARSVKRAKEVGVRKVCGATRRQLVFQFISESIIITTFASIIALVLVEFSLPMLNSYFGTDLSLFHFLMYEESRAFALVMLGLVVGVGSLSGFFPAFILSSFDPVVVLKIGGLNSRRFFRKNTVSVQVRKLLVISQFIIATSLIIVTFVIYKQIHFLKTVDMGFDKEEVLVVDLPKVKGIKKETVDSLVYALEENVFVRQVERALGVPSYKYGRISFDVEEADSVHQIPINIKYVGANYKDIFKLELIEGRFFHPDSINDSKKTFIVNESARRLLGRNLIGKKMSCGLGVDGKIIGVLKDFHYDSLKEDIKPMVFLFSQKHNYRLAIKLTTSEAGKAIEQISDIWQSFFPEYIMNYTFLEDNFNKHYAEEDKLFALFLFVAAMAILIALLGLFGLSTFVIEQQSKTIGIKKTLGASITRLVFSLIREFAVWVIIANLLAWPIAFLLSNGWLVTFAYHIELDLLWFAEASLLIFVFASLTVSFQAFNTASRPPVEALKYE